LILVDSSVWIDAFRYAVTPQTSLLRTLIGSKGLIVGDLIVTEVLQGIDSEAEFRLVLSRFQSMPVITIGGQVAAVEAARNYRHLRAKGITVRKTIDNLIATRCILDGHELLHSDRDFDPFVEHLGLRLVAA
jgi:predicted nucleic acid-binding protein